MDADRKAVQVTERPMENARAGKIDSLNKGIMMRKILAVALLLCSLQALAVDVDALRQKAMQGDYQAQRNLAYTLATGSGAASSQNPTLGCAWYKVILLSGSEKVNDGDIGNVKVYCGRLSADQQGVADMQAKKLAKKIYGG